VSRTTTTAGDNTCAFRKLTDGIATTPVALGVRRDSERQQTPVLPSALTRPTRGDQIAPTNPTFSASTRSDSPRSRTSRSTHGAQVAAVNTCALNGAYKKSALRWLCSVQRTVTVASDGLVPLAGMPKVRVPACLVGSVPLGRDRR
jgi:hypothetical protein